MKHFKIKEINNIEFDPSSIIDNVPFTQADFYGDWQKSLGRKARRFLVSDNGEVVAYFQLVKYPLLFGKNYLYAPYGPITKDTTKDFFRYIKKEIEIIAKKENAVFVRLDFTPVISSGILSEFFSKSPLYTYKSAYFQPRAEWFLGLGKTEEELLLAMHQKTRYSIRLAKRKDIETEIITDDFEKYFEVFYELMMETSKRNKFSLHNKKYYKNIFQNLSEVENSYLSIAKYNQKVLAIDLIIVFGGVANYVFGGSMNTERNRMPTYLAQWDAICYAKKIGCSYYNFGAISLDDKINKGWNGLSIFKKKFGGKEVVHSDFFDIVVNRFWYCAYNFRKLLKN